MDIKSDMQNDARKWAEGIVHDLNIAWLKNPDSIQRGDAGKLDFVIMYLAKEIGLVHASVNALLKAIGQNNKNQSNNSI